MASGLYSELFTLVVSLINRSVSPLPTGPGPGPGLGRGWNRPDGLSVLLRALKSSQHSLCSLLIVDTPGFQNPRLAAPVVAAAASAPRGATFEELCHNYTQERLQTLFQERTFVREMERYKEVPTAPPIAPPTAPPPVPPVLVVSVGAASQPKLSLIKAHLNIWEFSRIFPGGTDRCHISGSLQNSRPPPNPIGL